jgi:hypothetical protein
MWIHFKGRVLFVYGFGEIFVLDNQKLGQYYQGYEQSNFCEDWYAIRLYPRLVLRVARATLRPVLLAVRATFVPVLRAVRATLRPV